MLFSLVNNITISLFSSLINFTITIALKILINPRKNLEEEFKRRTNANWKTKSLKRFHHTKNSKF